MPRHRHRSTALLLAVAAAAAATAALLALSRPEEAAPRRFDLARQNEAFFTQLNGYTAAASSRRIVTLVALYNAWMNNSHEGWSLSPFNPRNNVNEETASLSDQDVFIRELGLAVEGDTSTPGRRFLRDVWERLTRSVAANTPEVALLQPLSEDFKDAGQFRKAPFYEQTARMWGKGNIVDNVRRIDQRVVPSAGYKEVHDSRERVGLLQPMTIVNTDDTCTPPASPVIATMAREAVARKSSYLVYDCDVRGTDWNRRVLDALREGLGGKQPAVEVGTSEGALVGYGFPDVWINLAANGKSEAFLDELQRAGGNFTFVLITLNPSIGTMMPWAEAGHP